MAKLTYRQASVLRELANGPLRRSSTNSTLCALEKRQLAVLDFVPSEHVPNHRVERWSITDKGRKAIPQ